MPTDTTKRPPALMTFAQVLEETQFSRSHVQRALASGKLPKIKSGRAIRIRREDLEAWLVSEN